MQLSTQGTSGLILTPQVASAAGLQYLPALLKTTGKGTDTVGPALQDGAGKRMPMMVRTPKGADESSWGLVHFLAYRFLRTAP